VKRSLLIGLAAVILLALGLWAASRQFRRPEPPAAPPAAGELADPGSDVVSEAMKSATPVAQIDSAAFKSRWLPEVRGVDLHGLDEKQAGLFLRFANAERCSCGCGYTLAGCKASDMSCEVSGAMIDALLDSIRTGKITKARGIRTPPPLKL
jgi:hypothetical protein